MRFGGCSTRGNAPNHPTGDIISASSMEPWTHSLYHPHHHHQMLQATAGPLLSHFPQMIGGMFQPLSPPSPEQTQQREPLPIGLFAQSVDREVGDLIGGAISHDLTQAAKEAGKKTCLAFSALCPRMAHSPERISSIT